MNRQPNGFHQESAPGGAPGQTDLFEVLRQDHEKLRGLIERIEASRSNQVGLRNELFSELERELLAHMEAEERFFYSALEQNDQARPRVLESYEEHQVAKLLVGAFTSLAVDDERWPAKLRVLSKVILRHMEDEEHELFTLAGKTLGSGQVQEILGRILALKHETRRP